MAVVDNPMAVQLPEAIMVMAAILPTALLPVDQQQHVCTHRYAGVQTLYKCNGSNHCTCMVDDWLPYCLVCRNEQWRLSIPVFSTVSTVSQVTI